MTKEEYNNIPVHYCSNCLSLAIVKDDKISYDSFCKECGSSEIDLTTIDVWEILYEGEYDRPFVKRRKYGVK